MHLPVVVSHDAQPTPEQSLSILHGTYWQY
jgi:hypothetical protein